MRIGLVVPQGWWGEYDGWSSTDAWRRTVEIAQLAEELGFESIWLVDHLHTIDTSNEIAFESFTSLSALAALTSRVRLGHIVICTAFRNPALTAKMISTMDTISGGRMELGIGAGWKHDEWLAYGYDFPNANERLARLDDDLGVITAMLAGDKRQHATYEGRYSSVRDAINIPKPIQQPRVPIMVGGNGPNVTWRLAAKYADELNLDGMLSEEVAEALPVIRSRCEEIGRDPTTLPVSVHVWNEQLPEPGALRVAHLAEFRALGLGRLAMRLHASARSDDALRQLARDAEDAGIEIASR